MNMDIEKLARWSITIAAVVFSAFFFLEARFWLRDEAATMQANHAREIAEFERRLADAQEENQQARLMMQSTRYAEVAHHYQDKMADGEELTDAEKARLDLVQRGQLRIHQMITLEDKDD